jgi:S-DNA-T family DNA segregation ATPase FtsK/SpoIIIE
MIDFMAEDGIVGAYSGSQAREVLLTFEQWQDMRAGGEHSPAERPMERVLDAG